MIVRQPQVQALTLALRANLEAQLTEHSRQYAPRLFQAAGEDGIRQSVRLGIDRARKYSFQDYPQVRFYIDLMLVLGSEFDSDPQYPWVADTLNDRFSRPHVRAMVLHRDLSLYLDRVMGPQKEHVKAALDCLVRLPAELPAPDQRSIAAVRPWLTHLFPQKSGDVTEAQMTQIADAASSQARQWQIPSADGLLCCVMLLFGHGATHDPLYPWISGVLVDPRITSAEGRLERLWARLRTYAASANKYLAAGI